MNVSLIVYTLSRHGHCISNATYMEVHDGKQYTVERNDPLHGYRYITGQKQETASSQPVKQVSRGQEPGVFDTVDEAIRAAKEAQLRFEDCTLATREKVIADIRAAMRPRVQELAQKTVEETGMGRVADKVLKLNLTLDKTPGVEDLITECETGDNGMTLYELSPYGVIGAITPSTNPAETLICNSIGMLAAGNAIFFSVHPGAKNLSRELVSELNQVIAKSIGIENLIVTLREPSIESAQEMMLHPDVSLLVVTGGPGVVKQALQSGKKVIGAGAGNPPAFVDETADIKKAAQDIVLGAS